MQPGMEAVACQGQLLEPGPHRQPKPLKSHRPQSHPPPVLLVRDRETLQEVRRHVTFASSLSLIFVGADNKIIAEFPVINLPPTGHKLEKNKSGTEISVVLCFEEIATNVILE